MKILLVGTGGYAANYVRILLENKNPDIVWAGVADPYFDLCTDREKILAAGIPVYASMEDFFARHTADLTVIATPTYLHCQQSICALRHGSHVLCEKPLAPTADEGRRMLEAEAQYDSFIAIGYQWSYSPVMQAVKRDILDGLFGAPILLKTAVSWPRSLDYYARGGGWGGRISWKGRLLLDSIAANACAHYMHNMLFLLGETMDTAAEIAEFDAECYRANEIENFDTCTILGRTAGGARLFFAASHAAGINRDPEFVYTFEKGTLRYAQKESSVITAEFSDGSRKIYGNPFENTFGKFPACIRAVTEGTTPVCTVKTALPHASLIQRLHEDVPIQTFPRDTLRFTAETNTVHVEGLYDAMYRAYDGVKHLSETM